MGEKLTEKPIETDASKFSATTSYFFVMIGGLVKRINPTVATTRILALLGTQVRDRKIREVSDASVTVTADDDIIIADASSNAVALLFPAAADMYDTGTTKTIEITVIRKAGSSNNVTITPDGSEQIDGTTSVVLSSAVARSVSSDGTALYSRA